MKNFLVEYVLKSNDGKVLKQGEMRVKRAIGEYNAKYKLEQHFKKKYSNFGKLECTEIRPNIDLDNLGEIFKGKGFTPHF